MIRTLSNAWREAMTRTTVWTQIDWESGKNNYILQYLTNFFRS